MSTYSNTGGSKPSAIEKAHARTEAEDKLWQALLDKPGGTAAELSAAAGIGKSTAPKILARWLEAGLVTRMSGIADGGRRAADRWSVQPAAEGQPATEPSADDTQGSDDAAAEATPSDDTDVSKRLAPGALRGMVEDYLREYAGEAISPNGIGKALTRSSGAVANALEKLVADGYAVRVNEKPRRYSITDTGGDAVATPK